MGSRILPDDFVSPIADLERRLRIIEATSRSGLGLPQGPLIAPLASDLNFGTSEVDIAAVTITVGERRRLRITFHVHIFNNDFSNPGGNNTAQIKIREGSTELARRTRAGIADSADVFGTDQADIDGEVYVTPDAGTHTYRITAWITHGPSENMTIVGAASEPADPAFISVEDVGMVPA